MESKLLNSIQVKCEFLLKDIKKLRKTLEEENHEQ